MEKIGAWARTRKSGDTGVIAKAVRAGRKGRAAKENTTKETKRASGSKRSYGAERVPYRDMTGAELRRGRIQTFRTFQIKTTPSNTNWQVRANINGAVGQQRT